jgi:hypothetical protein
MDSNRFDNQSMQELFTNSILQVRDLPEVAQARLVHTNTEYWKTQCDLYKHGVTIAVASLAASATLLGGGLLGGVEDLLLSGSGWGIVCLLLSLAGFLGSMLLAFRAAAAARDNLRGMWKVQSEAELYEMRQVPRFKYTARGALWTYSLGLAGFILLVLSGLFDPDLISRIGSVVLVVLALLALSKTFRPENPGRQVRPTDNWSLIHVRPKYSMPEERFRELARRAFGEALDDGS